MGLIKLDMRFKKVFIIISVVFSLAAFFYVFSGKQDIKENSEKLTDDAVQQNDEGEMQSVLDPLTIESLRQGQYPGSKVVIEQTLDSGSNYSRYIASYRSEGLKVYALLTVPNHQSPPAGWPVIIFNHGYIPPAQYQTTERYVAYVDGFARNSYIVFKLDYRGHGNSEGQPEGAYGSNAYTIDVLNAVSSIKKLKDPSTGSGQVADPDRIGMWGHSLGGFVTLRSMVVDKDIKAGVVWAGVVASYPDLLNRWRRGTPRPTIPGSRGSWRVSLVEKYGSPEDNPEFWNSISANSFLKDISGPLQLHHGTADGSVPVEFSEKLAEQLKDSGRTVELYTYPGDDHNISASFNNAMQRSIEFFNKYLKES